MYQNIVIGTSLVPVKELLASSNEDWTEIESKVTFYTQERYLPAILKEAGIVKSTSEVRRNRPDLCKVLSEPDCFWLKIGKRRLYIVVGE